MDTIIIISVLLFMFFPPFFVGMFLIYLLKKFSEKTNFLVDIPGGDILKIHTKNIPLLGGLAMVVSLIIGLSFFLEQDIYLKVIGFTLGLFIIFLLGFWDDLKWKHISTIKPFLKFVLLILCTFIPSIILSAIGISFNFFPYYIISIILGFAYIFVVINAINYQDGIDGLAGGLVCISLVGFAVISWFSYDSFTLMISMVALGSVIAFLMFNLPPAKMFMGDSGAYSLGFILAVLAMLFSKSYNMYSVLGPVFIIGLPIFDGIYANIRRIVAGKSIFLGDRSHFYDKLMQKGLSVKRTLLVCYSLQIALVLMGVLMYA